MTTTMLYPVSAAMDEPKLAPKTNASGKAKHRPKSLQIEPFDPRELSRKLNVVVAQQDDEPVNTIQPQQSPNIPLSAKDMNTPSPRTAVPVKQPTSATRLHHKEEHAKEDGQKKETRHQDKSAPAMPQGRRGSLFDRISFKGSNYVPEKDDEDLSPSKPAPYRHVPKVAAAQFARTTTVETVTQKAPQSKGMRPSPGPHSMNNGTMSLQEYNKQSRRAQSLCSGRPYERTGPHPFTVLESTAEVDEEPNQSNPRHSIQPHLWNKNFELGGDTGRRMSTGNMWPRHSSLDSHVSAFRRDSTGLVPPQQNNQNPASMRRGSSSSSGFTSETTSPFQRDSGPTSPFRQEFGGAASPNRRGSDNTAPPSRRGSVANIQNPQRVADIHRVDWSQSDQPAKPRRDSKWTLKGRLGSVSQGKPGKEEKEGGATEAETQPSTSPKSPKSGFLGRFKR